MRRALLILLALIVGGTGLFAGYVAWDYDADHVSPIVAAPSYDSLFEASVQRRVKRPFAALPADGQRKVLSDIILSREGDPVREVALYRLRAIADKRSALTLLRKTLTTLPPELFETGVGSAMAIDPQGSALWLDSLYRKLEADPAAFTPLGGYRTSTVALNEAGQDIQMEFRERTRSEANYGLTTARENTLFFPERPAWFLSVPNVDDVLGRFRESRFVTSLESTPVIDDAWSLPLLRTIAGLRARLTDAMGFLGSYFSPEELFRDEFLMGRYGDEYLIVSFRDKNVAVAEGLVSIFETLGKDFKIQRWTVDGIKAAGVRGSTGRMLAYATPGDYFVVATDTALLSRALHTWSADRAHSLGIDPIFRKEFAAVNPNGERQILFGWLNPTEVMEPTGSESPAARRLAILAAALGRDGAYAPPTTTSLSDPTSRIVAWTTLRNQDPLRLWRYIVDVRSLGKNPVDSLARLAKVDIAKQVMPYLSSTMRVGYGGIHYLRESYGYSHTGFDMLLEVPLAGTPPPGFDTTMRRLFAGITTLVYTRDTLAPAGAALWIARDTNTTDSTLLARKLQPSFGIVRSRLVVASTPEMLRAVSGNDVADGAPREYLSGAIKVDSLAGNFADYLKPLLRRSGSYTPDEIAERIDPLTRALGLYDRLEWHFTADHGVRGGRAALVAKAQAPANGR